jgi:hypothetical protein
MAISVSYGGTSLQTGNILMSDVGHDEQANRKIQRLELARGNGSKITNIQYTHKQITLTGRIFDTSVTGLRNRLDALKSALTGTQRNLDIDEGDGAVRRYLATLDGFTATRSNIGPVAAEITLSFVIPDAFGIDTSATTILSSVAISSTPQTFTPTFGGSMDGQQPLFTINLTTIGSGAFNTVTLGNSGSGQIIAVSRTWANADVLVVDCFNQIVTVNGSAVDYMGAFPSWPPGASSIQYTDDFTSRTASISGTNVNRYL